ncbi:MAG: hypothetical protein HY299_00570 [Verrucomicrobia bacterium]|nr:hypothetical protein [Verrucomicrobiota bacterium]
MRTIILALLAGGLIATGRAAALNDVVITDITVVSGVVELSFVSKVGVSYTLESSTDLAPGVWGAVGSPVLGDGALKIVTDSFAGKRTQFYRLVSEFQQGMFSITAMEFIQAVQTPSNSVPMIGYKTTYVRVSVRSDVPVALTGKLRAVSGRGVYEMIPSNPTISATPQGSNRRVWNETLNFRLDDDLVAPGSREFTASVFVAGDEANAQLRSATINFSQRIDLHVYGLVWSVKDNNDGQGAPLGPAAPWSDYEGNRRYVENVFPVSSLTIDPIPGVGTVAPNPQTFGNLVESREWADKKLGDLPPNSIIAILDNWDTHGLNGYAAGKRCETQNYKDYFRIGVVMAQEVSHCLGLWWHTFTPGTPYPRPDGSIGDDDIGLDLTGDQPRLISGVYDFMSYNNDSRYPKNWGSAFTYGKLLEAITGGAPGDPGDGLPQWFPSQTDWEGLGGQTADAPTSVTWGPNRLDIFVRGSNGGVYHKYWNGNQWGPTPADWGNLSGDVTGSPTAVSWGPDRIDLFARGTDGGVFHKYWNGNQWGPSPTDWAGLGGRITDSPAAVSWGSNRIDLFARGTDGGVYHKYWNGNQWGPSPTDWAGLGGLITDSPTAVSWGPNRIDVFARGLDGGVFHKYWDGNQWGPSPTAWQGLGGSILGSPVAVSWGPNRIDLFARGVNGSVYHKYWNGIQWGPSLSDWESLGGKTTDAPSVVSWGPGRLDVFVRGLDGAAFHKAWTGTDWSPRGGDWSSLGGGITGTPSAVSWSPNRLDVFVRGTDGRVYHKYRY